MALCGPRKVDPGRRGPQSGGRLEPRNGLAILSGIREFGVCLPKDTEGEMKNWSGIRLLTGTVGELILCFGANPSLAQASPPPDHPAVTVKGNTYTPRSILARNMGTEADRVTAFPPHRIIANVYYVGTNTLSSFLIATPQGHILIDSTYERTVPVIEKSVGELGFK